MANPRSAAPGDEAKARRAWDVGVRQEGKLEYKTRMMSEYKYQMQSKKEYGQNISK